MEHCGALWSRVEPYEALWSHILVDPYGTLWCLMEPCGAFIQFLLSSVPRIQAGDEVSIAYSTKATQSAVAASVSVGGAVEVLRNISISSDVVVVIIVVIIPLGENPKVVWPSLPPSLGRLAG